MYSRVRRGPHTRRGVLYILENTGPTKIYARYVQSVENIQWSGVARVSGVLHGILVNDSSA